MFDPLLIIIIIVPIRPTNYRPGLFEMDSAVRGFFPGSSRKKIQRKKILIDSWFEIKAFINIYFWRIFTLQNKVFEEEQEMHSFYYSLFRIHF